MNIEKELEELGYYLPGFLRLTINSDLDFIDLTKVMKENKKEFSTFLHEYIHFLQNITTVSGLYQSHHYVKILKYAIGKVMNDNEFFDIPIDLKNEVNYEAQRALHRVYAGDNKNINVILYQGYRSDDYEIIPDVGDVIKLRQYYIYYLDYQRRTEGEYLLGSTAIKEFVAHSIQNKFFSIEAPDTPYKIVDLLISNELPLLADKLDLKVMMCEASLMTFHPAETLILAIEQLKMSDDIPQTTKGMYDYVVGLRMLDTDRMFNDIYETVVAEYSDIFQTRVFESDLNWLKVILTRAKDLRTTEPDYLCRFVLDSGHITKTFSNVLDFLGTPFFTNKQMKGFFISPKEIDNPPEQIYLLNTVAEIINILFGKQSCGMFNFCNQEKTRSMVSEQCNTAPWKNLNGREFCPFCQLWRTWEMYEKQPRINR